ncbi:MAG: SagB/ThcOx family dehydrogenase [Syntrophales bacterium]|nr:SagB/ThcOx family dehydrogenase [Syntrophales bacterium]
MKNIKKIPLLCLLILLIPTLTSASNLKPIKLIKPQMDAGRQLMLVLKERKSSREFSSKKLPLRVISNLLWSACGVNRPAQGKRTAPSTRNWQEIDVYVSSASGLYLYVPKDHVLLPIHGRDIRELTGTQGFVGKAPVNLVYVADLSRMSDCPPEERDFYAALDTGFIAQNVYLYCASEGLVTVFRTSIDREQLRQAMNLRADQKIIGAQTVGYPTK